MNPIVTSYFVKYILLLNIIRHSQIFPYYNLINRINTNYDFTVFRIIFPNIDYSYSLR